MAAFASLLLAPAAVGGGSYAKVIGPGGHVISLGSGRVFDYPSDGSLVHVGSAETSTDGATLNDVQLLGGIVNVSQIDVFANGQVSVGTIAAAGRLVTAAPNRLVPLGSLGYLMIEQTAVSRGNVGRVGLRLVVQSSTAGAPSGTQVLVGTPSVSSRSAARRAQVSAGSFDPLAVLGLPSDGAGTELVPPPSLTSDSIGERAVAIAERFLGVPYVWGGASPVPGFDCSGLAMYVYGRLGVNLTHYTGAQFFEGMQVPRSELAPGDLVFFDANVTLGPQHEGIYVGDGRFIHAPHTGDVVKISSLDDPAYGLSFVGAVRPSVGKTS
jgi:cell wall-associated NlpC family hydrolase